MSTTDCIRPHSTFYRRTARCRADDIVAA